MMPVLEERRGLAAEAAGRVAEGPRRGTASVRAAAGFRLLAGGLERAAVRARRAIDARIAMDSLRTNRHFVWMIPLSNALIFAAIGVVVAGLAKVRPWPASRLGWRFYPALAALALVLTVPGLYPVA